MIHWEAPGPYVVAFSTRVGGVSEGAFESLNLGIYTADDPERVAAAVTVGPRILERLRAGSAEPADVVAAADPYAPDAPLFAMALEERPELDDYFRRLRNVQLEVSGSDLAELGLGESPEVGEILAELRRRKLNGQLDGRESELAAARELITR